MNSSTRITAVIHHRARYHLIPLQNQIVLDLGTRVEELKMENEYKLRLNNLNFNEMIKELTEKFNNQMEPLKTNIQVSLYSLVLFEW